MQEPKKNDVLTDVEKHLQKMVTALENIKIREYVEFLNNRQHLFLSNFLAGMARGLGMAVGFTILGAVLLALLKQIVLLNLPLISDFIADLIQLVNESLKK
ncbi:MAG TPA: hypothetical protein GX687_04640 [Clostridia bacterium]|nr:hypothetical protein [Clostridia bacterium]